MAANGGRPPQPPGGELHHRGAAVRALVHEALRLHGPGLHGLGRLHGPRQLGDRPRRRRALRLHAALRHHAVEPDGDPAAGAGRPARHRHRPRPGAGLPCLLPAPGLLPALGRLRARDHRLRPGRGDRHRDRAQPALRHPADLGRDDHRARRLPGALPDEPRLPRARGLHRRAAPRHLRLLRDPDRRRRAAARGRARRHVRPLARDRDQPGDALHRHGHDRRHRDAAQPLPALLDRADPRLSAHRARQARRDQVGHRRTRRSR